ncbi:MAG: PEP-CTERM sorting domain-containing protein [Armatimonadetes bacterium]|nr:PEP-CTERM sorting domain-containing protein [Armatimonadota bacterium]
MMNTRRTALTVVASMLVLGGAQAQTWYIGTNFATSVAQESAWQTAVGGAPLENFDSDPLNKPYGNISTVGLTVRTYADTTQALVTNGGNTFTRSGDQFLWNTSHLKTYFDANSLLSAFGYWAAGGDGDTHVVSLFDSSGALIGTNTVVAGQNLPSFLGVVSNVPIATVLIEAPGFGGTLDSLGFDDVQTKAVPEPATVVGSGLAGLALVRRRRRRTEAA